MLRGSAGSREKGQASAERSRIGVCVRARGGFMVRRGVGRLFLAGGVAKVGRTRGGARKRVIQLPRKATAGCRAEATASARRASPS